MKISILITAAAAALAMTSISARAQVNQTIEHSERNAQGGFDTITKTAEVAPEPPKQPPLAMYDPAMDKTNPYIAMNDPSKFGHPVPKPAYNHDGQAFMAYVRPSE